MYEFKLTCFLLTALYVLTTCQEATVKDTTANFISYQCPPGKEIAPCRCQKKENGLHVFCEFTDQRQLSRTMRVFKDKAGTIFDLKLRHSNLEKLPGFLFYDLKIRQITIHNSKLASLRETFSSTVGNDLSFLDLSQNNLSSISSAGYQHLHYVLSLNLNDNRIDSIQNNSFLGMDNLQILTMSKNKISTIDPDGLVGLERKLRTLNLSDNRLFLVPHKALLNLRYLEVLEIRHNLIKTIQKADFQGARLSNLRSLGLAFNKLTEIPRQAFFNLQHLVSLDLNGNNISIIDSSAFVGLEHNLQFLRLAGNNIFTIPLALPSLQGLIHVDFRSNHISLIDKNAFAENGSSITYLNLENNAIKNISNFAFQNLTTLVTLNLRNNKITSLSEAVMETILSTLEELDISENPLVCDCELQWYADLLKYLKKQSFKDEVVVATRTVCVLPKERRKYQLENLPLRKLNCSVTTLVQSSNSCPKVFTSTLTKMLSLCFLVVIKLLTLNFEL